MMEHALFFLFSFIEFTGGISLILAVFLFNLRSNLSHIFFSAFMLTQASYLMRIGANLEDFSVLIQMLLLILYFRFMFRIQVFYAALMGIIGYIMIALFQMFIMFVTILISPVTFEQIIETESIRYLIQTITAILSVLLAWMFTRYRIGFSFIPDTDTIKVKFNSENILILSLLFLGALTLLFLYFTVRSTIIFPLLIVMLIIQMSFFIYLALRKEKHYD